VNSVRRWAHNEGAALRDTSLSESSRRVRMCSPIVRREFFKTALGTGPLSAGEVPLQYCPTVLSLRDLINCPFSCQETSVSCARACDPPVNDLLAL